MPTPTELTRGAALKLKADRSVREGEFRRAVKFYQRSLRANPKDHVAWNNMGVALARLGQTKDAIDSYTEALRLRPKYTKA